MNGIKANQYVKLGTTLRYLIDVKEGEPFGGKHILQNIDTVVALIDELGFISTSRSAGITQLKELSAILKTASTGSTAISKEQAEKLEKICRKIRDSLLTEGDGIEVVRKNGSGVKQALEVPEKVTSNWLFVHVPVPLWFTFIGLLIAAYSFGVTTSKYEIVRDVFKLEQPNKKPDTKSEAVQPNISLQPSAGSGG